MPRKRGSKVATPSAKWSASEIAAMLAAWRDALEAPAYRGFTVRTHMFDQFVERCGGATPRALASVCFKRETLRNMVDLICEYHESVVEGEQGEDEVGEEKQDAASSSTGDITGAGAGDPTREFKWFSLSILERKDWFEVHNTRSYTYLDIDVDTFREVKELQEMAQRYECTRLSKSGGPRVKKEQNEGERQAVHERKRAALSSQAAVDLAAALIARPMKNVTPTAAAATAESRVRSSSSGGEQRSSIHEQTPATETVAAAVIPATASVINDVDQYGSETQEEDESSIDSSRHHHHHHHHHHDAGYDGSSTESDSDAGVWDEDQDQDLGSGGTEEDNQATASSADCSSEGGEQQENDFQATVSRIASQNSNEMEAPTTTSSSEDVLVHHKDNASAGAIPVQTNPVDRRASQPEEVSSPSEVELPPRMIIEASATITAGAINAHAQDHPQAHQGNRNDKQDIQAVEVSTHAQKGTSTESPIKAPSLSKITPVANGGKLEAPTPVPAQAETVRRELERQLAVDRGMLKIVKDLETQAEHLKILQNQTKRAKMLDQEKRQKDLERMRKLDKAVLELKTQMKDVQTKQNTHRDESNLAVVARNKRFAEQLDLIRTEGRDERYLLVSQINQMQAQWEKRDAERQREAEALKLEIATLLKEASARNDALAALKVDLAEMRRLETARLQKEASAKDDVLTALKVDLAEMRRLEMTKLQKEASARDGVVKLIRHDLAEMRRKMAQAAAKNEATQASIQPDYATVRTTDHAPSAVEDKRVDNPTEKVLSVAPARAQTRVEAILEKETEAEIEEPEKEKVFAEKTLQPREPSPKRVIPTQPSVITTKPSPEPAKEVPRETKAPKVQNTVPVQLIRQPASPLEAKSPNQAVNKDQPVKILKVAQSTTTSQEAIQRSTLPQSQTAVQRPKATKGKETRNGNQPKSPAVADPGRERKRRRAVLAKETDAGIKQPDAEKVLAEKKLQPRDPSPQKVTARQSGIIKAKQSPAPMTLQGSSSATKSVRDQDPVPVQVFHPAAAPLDAKSSTQVKSNNQPVKVHKIAQLAASRESTPRSTPQSQTKLGDTTREGLNAAEAKTNSNQPKKAKSVGPGRDRKRKRAVLAEATKAPARGPEKREVLAEKEVQPREPSSKRVSARKPNTTQAKQPTPEPEKMPRTRKTPKAENIAPAQVSRQSATPVDAKPSDPGKTKDQPAKIQKSPLASVADPEQVPDGVQPVPTYRTRGSRSRMKENAT